MHGMCVEITDVINSHYLFCLVLFCVFLQDRFLPIHNVARIMRNAIPRNGKVRVPIRNSGRV